MANSDADFSGVGSVNQFSLKHLLLVTTICVVFLGTVRACSHDFVTQGLMYAGLLLLALFHF